MVRQRLATIFFLNFLEKFTKDFPGESYLVVNINPRYPGEKPLLATGYKYNSRMVLQSIATYGDGSTKPGDRRLCTNSTGG